MQATFQDFPIELIIEVFANLDHTHILRCAAVCKSFNAVVRDSHKLRYTIELAFDGLVNLPQSEPTPVYEKLQRLLSCRNAWRTLAWKHNFHVPMSGSCRAYELVSGTFAKSIGTHVGHGSRHFIMSTLPSRKRPDPRFIITEDVGVPSKDFVIDPTQDLIGYVSENGDFPQNQIQINIMTISSHRPHPEAANPVISHTCGLPFVMTNSFVAIAEDVLAIFFWIENPGLIIWNWRSGKLLVYVNDYGGLPPGIWDFSFISNRAFILTSRELSGSIEIYVFQDPPTNPELTRVASLRLPALQPTITPALFSTHSGPFTADDSPSANYTALKEKPFTISKHSRIHAMCIQYLSAGGHLDRRFRFFFFVKNDFFLKLVNEHRAGETRGVNSQRTLIWEEWGVENTRFLAYGMQPRWLRYVHGLRVVCPPYPSDEGSLGCVLEVFDFNVHPKRLPGSENLTRNVNATRASEAAADKGAEGDMNEGRAGNSSPSLSSSSSSSSPSTRPSSPASSSSITREVSYTVNIEPSTISASAVFVDDVISKLPYIKTVRKDLSLVYSGFMIDDERIVGIKTSPDGEMGDIDVFVF